MATDAPDAKKRRVTQRERLGNLSESGDFRVRLGEICYPLYNRLYSSDSAFVTKTQKKLSQARVDQTPELFISRSLGYGFVSMLVTGGIGTFISFLVFAIVGPPSNIIGVPLGNGPLASIIRTLRFPIILLTPPLILGGIGFVIGFYSPNIFLGLKASERKREIDFLLPDTISYMYALSIGGMNQLEIMESVAESEDVYGELSYEFQTILQETKYFDTDYRTAIRHRADETPSDNLSQFLTDMLSILSSGGDLQTFLDDKTDVHLRKAKESQKDMIEVLELFGEMYLNVSLLPLLLLILITIMQIMGSGSMFMLYLVIYVLIPMIGVGFLVMMSTILSDEPGDGKLSPNREKDGTGAAPNNSVLDFKITERYKGLTNVFDEIYTKERNKRVIHVFTHPHKLFIERPETTLLFTIPLTIAAFVIGITTGSAPITIDGLFNGLWGTVFYFYMPVYIIFTPLTIFYYIHSKRQQQIKNSYTEALRKLSSANDTGQTLLESFVTVAETSTGRLSDEFLAISAKVDHDYTIRQAIVEFNNKYQIPEIARINNLIIDAQKTSTQISNVLITAAQSSENQDKLRRERASRTRMQIVMLLMTYLILMGVIAMLYDQFIGSLAEVGQQTSENGGTSGAFEFDAIDVTEIGVLFLHGVILQAVTAGILASYLQSNTIRKAGLYIIPLSTIALIIWTILL